MKYEHPLLKIDLQNCIHWFAPQSATGKSYFAYFVVNAGIQDLDVFAVSTAKQYQHLDDIMNDGHDIVVLDRTDLFLELDDFANLAKYKDKCILIDSKLGVPGALLNVGYPVDITCDGREMTLSDVNYLRR